MVIENNPKELAAMKKFHEGNRAAVTRRIRSCIQRGI